MIAKSSDAVRSNDDPVRILIVDDHPLIREGLTARISTESDMSVCAQADDAAQALAILERSPADLVIIDLYLHGRLALDLIKAIAKRFPGTQSLVVTAYDENVFAERALLAGAKGFVNKQRRSDEVVDAIRSVLKGNVYISAETGRRLLRRDRSGPDEVARLTSREVEVFELIGRGYGTSAIANRLEVSVHTIDSHRQNIRQKLDLKSGAELTQRAVQWLLENR